MYSDKIVEFPWVNNRFTHGKIVRGVQIVCCTGIGKFCALHSIVDDFHSINIINPTDNEYCVVQLKSIFKEIWFSQDLWCILSAIKLTD